MKQYTEDIDQIGTFYKGRFDVLSDDPEPGCKNDLFAKMDLLDGKRTKTVYLHFNLFGMKIAASITMLIVSSLALVAVAAVTILAVRNNTKTKPAIQLSPSKSESVPAKENSIQKNNKKVIIKSDQGLSVPSNEAIPEEKSSISKEIDSKVNEVPKPVEEQPSKNIVPVQKNGDNSKVLKEIDEEEDLFSK